MGCGSCVCDKGKVDCSELLVQSCLSKVDRPKWLPEVVVKRIHPTVCLVRVMCGFALSKVACPKLLVQSCLSKVACPKWLPKENVKWIHLTES